MITRVYYKRNHMGKDLHQREEQFKKQRIDPIEVCKIQLGWLKENVKEQVSFFFFMTGFF
jgi:hypothetical protein